MITEKQLEACRPLLRQWFGIVGDQHIDGITEAILTAAEAAAWTKVFISQPQPHASYLVRRRRIIHTATPCYGMHAPWWVPRAISGDEYDPVPMLDDDEWCPL